MSLDFFDLSAENTDAFYDQFLKDDANLYAPEPGANSPSPTTADALSAYMSAVFGNLGPYPQDQELQNAYLGEGPTVVSPLLSLETCYGTSDIPKAPERLWPAPNIQPRVSSHIAASTSSRDQDPIEATRLPYLDLDRNYARGAGPARVHSPCSSLSTIDSQNCSPLLMPRTSSSLSFAPSRSFTPFTPSSSSMPSPFPLPCEEEHAVDDTHEDDESLEEDGDDGEYLPSPSPPPRTVGHAPSKREGKAPARPSPYPTSGRVQSTRLTPSLASLSLSAEATPARTAQRLAISRRRNCQVVAASPLHGADSDVEAALEGAQGLACPLCPYVAPAKRVPDFKRHVRTHYGSRHRQDFVCCGVPLRLAAQYGVVYPPPPSSPDGAAEGRGKGSGKRNRRDPKTLEPFVYAGELMFGGCQETFSRKDAYIRHLRPGVCKGDAQAPWLLGNAGGKCKTTKVREV
ncbi:hypothetical protein BC628DRAFT_1338920 [Trametes gibbosa]|uniref:Zinc finger protein 220 n=1 Tax=Trametes gibbosa TaxID=160864 RepID=A0A6B9KD42_9APHY|nr:hypothetical protein BC628DRAFT_1338920 [Trametes gibbosa]QHA24593.1 zinc finger protein 220 [Trametes gibbosa]